MDSFYDKVSRAKNQFVPPVVAKLEGVFETLDDAELLHALNGKIHRGCQGYSVESLWRSYLVAYVQNIPSVSALIRYLTDQPSVADACGLGAIPSDATYSRFVAKLSKHTDLVAQTMKNGVDTLRDNLPNFGKAVAIDSTDIRAYSATQTITDHDAAWGRKKKHGKPYWWLGYKAHIVSCAVHELPIHVEVTPANVSDSQMFKGPLSHANITPTFVLADAGYDSIENHRWVYDDLKAIPIIKLNRRGKKVATRVLHRSMEQVRAHNIREYAGIHRDSARWSQLYSMRTSVERLISRQKEHRRLSVLRHRGMAKATLHVYLSTLTIVASAVSALYSEQSLRKVA